MKLRTKLLNCRSRSSALASGGQTGGYALLIIMMLAGILLVSLTAALPSIYTAGQREREEELIFRGTQYARAIALFRRQFGRYPASVKELLETNRMRFLRRAYPDPMSRKGKWRFIHADANGTLLDSRTQGPTPPSPGTNPQSLMAGPGETKPPNPAASPKGARRERSASSENETLGAFIVGVASSSPRESIRVWNNRTHYDEWEFIGIEAAGLGVVPPIPGQAASPEQRGTFGPPGVRMPGVAPRAEGFMPRK